MNGALDDFAKQYAAESGISLSNPSSAILNKNRGISKGRASGYGMDIPVGISNKNFIYAFVDVVSLMSFVVKRRFGLKNKVSALFAFTHSSICPSLIFKQTSATSRLPDSGRF